MKILVVDDSKSIRQLLAACLSSMGHEIFYANNGEECIDFVTKNEVDLILMDVEMPGVNGITATKAIRECKHLNWFPIIFLTNHIDDETFTNGILAGGDSYLTKPINLLRLQLTIIAMERIYVMRQTLQKTKLELERVNQELKRLSFCDQLTGLANRRSHDVYLEKQFNLAKRNKSPLSLIICDIDYFKNYNDTYGHQIGDECLKQVANCIAAQLSRPTFSACRYGGEEFTVILPDIDTQQVRQIAEQIRQQVLDKNIPHAASLVADVKTVTVSLGITTYTGQYKNPPDLTKAADIALYKAKELGRNRAEVALEIA